MKEMFSEEQVYNDRIMELRKLFNNLPFGQFYQQIPFIQGIPLTPYPRLTRCLGVTPINGVVRIRDRYVQVGFDLKVEKADYSCLYSDFEKGNVGLSKLFKGVVNDLKGEASSKLGRK